MEGYIRIGIIIVTLVLGVIVAWDIGNTVIINKRWPEGLSKETNAGAVVSILDRECRVLSSS